jgi:hypothetical protein
MPLSTRATQVVKNTFSDPSSSVEILAFFNNPASLGLVTSVGLVAPAEFSVSGSPVTGASNITLAWVNESANTFFAGPSTGAATTPAFRALAVADIPLLPTTKVDNLANTLAGKAPLDSPVFTTTANFGVTTLGFYGSSPVARPTGDILSALGTSGLGLVSSPTISEADVTNLTTDLGLKAPLASPTFTGTVTMPVPTLPTQSPNLFFGGPSSGSAAAPTFRLPVFTDFISLFASPSIVSVTGATTAQYGALHLCSGTSANYAVTLPAVSAGGFLGFQMASGLTKLVTITRAGSALIDGATTRIMWAGESAFLYSDGTNWFKLFGKIVPMTCVMYRNAGGFVIPSGTPINIPMDTISSDPTGAMADNVTNNRINIVRASNYTIAGVVTATAGAFAGTQFFQGILAKTGSGLSFITSTLTSGQIYQNQPSSVVSCVVGDFINIAMSQTSGVNATANGGFNNIISVFEIPSW